MGNKSDMEGKAVTTEQAKAYADSLEVPFLETSAKDATNVEEAFLTMAGELIRLREASASSKPAAGGVKLSSGKGSGKKCCPA